MIEARIFIDSLDEAKQILTAQKAICKGQYKIIDEIYRSTDTSVTLNDEFLRLRVVPENIWNEKEVILAIKNTQLQAVGKNSTIPLKLQYDTKHQAETYYLENLSDKYVKDFSFSRIGWQYLLNNDVVDLEIIEDKYPSIEFKSETAEGLEKLLTLFDVSSSQVISGPSVIAVREILNL